MYKLELPIFLEHIGGLGEQIVSDRDNSQLRKIPNASEIWQAVWELHPLKALGPYRYLRIFYKTY